MIVSFKNNHQISLTKIQNTMPSIIS